MGKRGRGLSFCFETTRNQTALELDKREGRNRAKTENEGKEQKEECVEGWERRSMRLSGRVWGEETWGEWAVWKPGWKEHALRCSTKRFGQRGSERKFHSWFLPSARIAPAQTEGNASREFLLIGSVLPWGGPLEGSTFPTHAYILGLPPLQPGPSRLVPVLASSLEMARWRNEAILGISDHQLEGVCSAGLWQLISIGYFHSALKAERGTVAADLRQENMSQSKSLETALHCTMASAA